MNQLLITWMRNQEIDDKLIYKNAAIKQMSFVNNILCNNLLHTPVFVASVHCSKSVILPVYTFTLDNGIRVFCRENFYGWVVSINSPFKLSLTQQMLDCMDDPNESLSDCYCEGFDKKWVFPKYKKSCNKCTFRIYSNYSLYTFMYLLKYIESTESNHNKWAEPAVKKEDIYNRCLEIARNNMWHDNDMPNDRPVSSFEIFQTIRIANDYKFKEAHGNISSLKYYFDNNPVLVYSEFVDRVWDFKDELLPLLADELFKYDLGENSIVY